MNKPAIFTAITVVIIGGATVTWAASKIGILGNGAIASEPYAPAFGAQIEPLPMMAHTDGLPVQQIAHFAVVFVEPVAPTAVASVACGKTATHALLDQR